MARLNDKIDNVKRKITRLWNDLDTKTQDALLTEISLVTLLILAVTVIAVCVHGFP